MFLKTTFIDLWNDFWDYMSDTYFNITMERYENIGLTPTATTISVIVFGMFFGVFIATIVAMLNKNSAGVPVRALLSRGAIGRENALTLSELSLEKKHFTRYSLRHNLVVRKIVAFIPLSEREICAKPKKKSVNAALDAASEQAEEEYRLLRELPTAIDYENTAFYIPEPLKYAAEFRFDAKGTNWKWVIFTIVIFFALVFLLLRFLPEFFQFIDNLVGVIKG